MDSRTVAFAGTSVGTTESVQHLFAASPIVPLVHITLGIAFLDFDRAHLSRGHLLRTWVGLGVFLSRGDTPLSTSTTETWYEWHQQIMPAIASALCTASSPAPPLKVWWQGDSRVGISTQAAHVHGHAQGMALSGHEMSHSHPWACRARHAGGLATRQVLACPWACQAGMPTGMPTRPLAARVGLHSTITNGSECSNGLDQ